MRSMLSLSAALAAVALVAVGCAGAPLPREALALGKSVPVGAVVEFQSDRAGRLTEVKFPIAESALPETVRKVVDEKCPGRTTETAVSFTHGAKHYVVNRAPSKGGGEVETIVHEDGSFCCVETTVPAEQIPAAVMKHAHEAVPGGELTKTEEIRDGDGDVFEYHVKKTIEGVRYKIVLGAQGKLKVVYREIPADVEIPMRAPTSAGAPAPAPAAGKAASSAKEAAPATPAAAAPA
ncbi:MAG: hypothetical protein HY719_14340, partial [Planctomycetes bacterium]|nr:hypothetical protein [Planctomycetota bacterium]